MIGPNRPIKAEILLTRRCDLRCPHCGIVRTDVEERSPEYWLEACVALRDGLGVAFFPIYGGEPLLYRDLIPLTRLLSNEEIAFTYISNSIKLYQGLARELVNAGLRSWTVSVDTLATERLQNKMLRRRNSAALNALLIFKELGLPDLQAQATISPFNVQEIPQMVKYFSGQGIWFSFDVIHGSKTYEPDAASKVVPDTAMVGDHRPFDLASQEHREQLLELSETLIDMRKNGYLIYQNERILRMLGDPYFSIRRVWSCFDYGYPGWLSINADGSCMCCDDLEHRRLAKFDALTVADRYEEFVECWREVAATCRGCFWSTHVQSYGQAPEYVQHKELEP